MNKIKLASRISGFEKPTIWTRMSELAIKNNCLNLGQGFPSWDPPKFFQDDVCKYATSEGFGQYNRAYGHPELVTTLGKHYSNVFNRTINPMNDICVTAGAVSALASAFSGIVEDGDEVIVTEPAYDCYLAQIQISGGKYIGLPMKAPAPLSQKELKERIRPNGDIIFDRTADSFAFDFEGLKTKITSKTKILVLNSPHNPTGKVFTTEEYQKIADILKPHPQIIVISDEVYEFNLYEDIKTLPRIANVEGMWDRTISIFSCGKTFSSTGIRIGIACGPSHLLQAVRAIHQYQTFCLYLPLQLAVANGYKNHIMNTQSDFLPSLVKKYKSNRDLLIKTAADYKTPFKFYLPESGFFMLMNIQDLEVQDKYMIDPDNNEQLTKDYGYCLQLANEKKVVFIPCSVFYGSETKSQGSNFVRAAFCKTQEMITEAGKIL